MRQLILLQQQQENFSLASSLGDILTTFGNSLKQCYYYLLLFIYLQLTVKKKIYNSKIHKQ